jgi:hypothetical protein
MFKRNFAKLNQAMGFQRSSNRQKVQPGVSDLSSNERAPNSCHPVINGSAVSDDANYSSWMVSSISPVFSIALKSNLLLICIKHLTTTHTKLLGGPSFCIDLI